MSRTITTTGTAELRIYNHFVGGREREPANGRFFDRINPATGEVDAMVAIGCRTDISQAVKAAREAGAQVKWRGLGEARRAQLLLNVANQMGEWSSVLARIDSVDVGKPICDSRADLMQAIETWKYYASIASQSAGEVHEHNESDLTYTVREPVGVVGILLPWTSPTLHFSRYVAAALACGNTVVVKPSERAPRSALKLAETCKAAGIPDGVVNVVIGDGSGTGAALAEHRDVDHICFIGSSEVGKLVCAMTTSRLAGISCELSAKNFAIVFADCDIDNAVDGAIEMAFRCQGQSNLAVNNVLVEEHIHKSFLKRLTQRAKSIALGPPIDENTTLSCLANAEQLERIECFVKIGKEEGAKLICGGEQPSDPKLSRGYYYKPTIFDEVKPDMTIVQEEIFGPVLSIIPFTKESEAVTIANSTRYGMAAAVYTNDFERIGRLSTGVEVGNVFINRPIRITPNAAWCGLGESGLGSGLGIGALNALTRLRTIDMRTGNGSVS